MSRLTNIEIFQKERDQGAITKLNEDDLGSLKPQDYRKQNDDIKQTVKHF